MYCPNCGNQIAVTSTFCPVCGCQVRYRSNLRRINWYEYKLNRYFILRYVRKLYQRNSNASDADIQRIADYHVKRVHARFDKLSKIFGGVCTVSIIFAMLNEVFAIVFPLLIIGVACGIFNGGKSYHIFPSHWY